MSIEVNSNKNNFWDDFFMGMCLMFNIFLINFKLVFINIELIIYFRRIIIFFIVI